MTSITLQEVQASLSDVVHRMAPGERITITENGRPVAELIVPWIFPQRPPRPRPPVTGAPRAGSVPGLVVPDDFKEPLEELKEYME
jgi:antitoxin (DNA-binding transcriptional repressor) of toxin-antitoxin stability system